MEPKPFDLEKAKAGEAIMYQGEPVKFGAYLPDAYEACRVVAITSEGYLLHADKKGYVTADDDSTLDDYRTLIKEEAWEVPE